MQLPPLTDGHILRRYKRFLADVRLVGGEQVTAHVPNTGAMTGCWAAGAPVQLSHSDNPRRKLAWTLERVDMGAGWVGVNTMRVNGVIAEGIEAGRIEALRGYSSLRREVSCELPGQERARLDLVLDGGARGETWVEVKNTTLLVDGQASFPDAVTVRGRKHLDVLAALARQGRRAVILYAVNRPEGGCFRPAREVDPAYAQRLVEVGEQGVEILAIRIEHYPEGMQTGECLPILLSW